MFKAFRLLAIMILLTFSLSACGVVNSVTGQYVVLDPDLQTWIAVAVSVAVGYLLMQLANIPALKWLADKLGEAKPAIVAWLSGVIVQLLQLQILDKIPQLWDNVVTIVMQLIVAVIVTLYTFKRLREKQYKAFM